MPQMGPQAWVFVCMLFWLMLLSTSVSVWWVGCFPSRIKVICGYLPLFNIKELNGAILKFSSKFKRMG
uniref:ATP synthase subunit 8 n=1 Tax=Myadora brevis TaxID=457650 RepID=A0A1U9XPI7_9BIVA|nr:ATP synthase F0 subunit 8 [Myadora brevis]AQZ26169.1 ATP synthase subunit 8 [Myadora brevis]